MAYTFDQIFAVDESNPQNVARNSTVLIFEPGDAAKTPLTLTTPDGQPLANPVPINANGFGPAFMHATLDRVAWEGAGFSNFFTSYDGMKEVAVAAQAAANASATAAAASAALVGAPADTAVQTLVNNAGSATRGALNATFVPKWKATTAYLAGDKVLNPTGDVVSAKVNFTSGASYNAADWDLSPTFALKGSGGSALPRVAAKLATGQNIKVTFVGDSGLEGTTAGSPGTDDAASLFTADLAARFGVTVTKSNRAVSGHTPYWHFLTSISATPRFTNALADAADLYVISFGHNDIRSDQVLPGTGYPQAAAMGAIEHMIRRIRHEVPGADIVLSNEWQYTGTSNASNTQLFAHGKALARLAADYGCGFADYTKKLADLGVTGTTPAVDDIYVHPTGQTGAQHPTSAGHRAWADTFLALLPTGVPIAGAPVPSVPPGLYKPERYGKWVSVAAMGVRAYGTDGYRPVGTSWGGVTTLPITSSTAGDYIDAQFVGSECSLRLDTGGGQGTVKITIDAVDVYASLNLGIQSGGQTWIPITGLMPGIHRVVVTVLSGSVTFRGLEVLTAPVEKIKHDSSRITYTGTWAAQAVDATRYYGSANQTTTLNDSFTVDFVGTALTMGGFRYTTALSLGVNIDGVALTDVAFDGATANGTSHVTLASGLPYGRHTAVITLKSAGRALAVSGLTVYDETRTARPTRVGGVAKVGETITLETALPGAPAIRLTPADATSTAPPYATARTTTGFTVNGTAAALVEWDAESGRAAW